METTAHQISLTGIFFAIWLVGGVISFFYTLIMTEEFLPALSRFVFFPIWFLIFFYRFSVFTIRYMIETLRG